MNKQFICDACHQIFDSNPDQSEEEKIEEAKKIFGEDPIENNHATVCDYCFIAIGKAFGWK